jgi:hypothetical protein
MRLLIPALVALTLGTCPVEARQFSAVCSNLSGVRVNDTGSRHAFTPDAVEGASWAYTWNVETKQATLIFQTSKAAGGLPNTQKGTVSAHRGGFFTMVTSLPGAVWTHTIYADSGRLLVTQSTTKNSADLSGRMLVGTCKMSR